MSLWVREMTLVISLKGAGALGVDNFILCTKHPTAFLKCQWGLDASLTKVTKTLCRISNPL